MCGQLPRPRGIGSCLRSDLGVGCVPDRSEALRFLSVITLFAASGFAPVWAGPSESVPSTTGHLVELLLGQDKAHRPTLKSRPMPAIKLERQTKDVPPRVELKVDPTDGKTAPLTRIRFAYDDCRTPALCPRPRTRTR